MRGCRRRSGAGARRYDAVTARAVAPLAVLVEYAAPLLRADGVLVAWKGARDRTRRARARQPRRRLGMAVKEVLPVQPFAGPRTVTCTSSQGRAHAAGVPAPAGMARKRPLANGWIDGPPRAAIRRRRYAAGRGRPPPNTFPTDLNRRFGLVGTVYAVANQKGGVGKTTTAVNLGACVADAGYRTLLVDLDPQCNATVALGLPKDGEPNIYDCLLGRARRSPRPRGPERHRQPRRRALHAATSPAPTSSCRASRAPRPRLRDAPRRRARALPVHAARLPAVARPAHGQRAGRGRPVIVPVQTEYFALEGLAQFLDTLALIQRELNPRLDRRRDAPHDARRAHAAGAGRRARGARALPGAGLRHGHPAQRPGRRGAELRASR